MSEESAAGRYLDRWKGIDPSIDVSQLVSSPEVAKILGIKVHTATILRWAHHPRFPAPLVTFPEGDGRVVRFWLRSEVADFAATRQDLIHEERQARLARLRATLAAKPNARRHLHEQMAKMRAKKRKKQPERIRVTSLPSVENEDQ